jgi:hypothetical protein
MCTLIVPAPVLDVLMNARSGFGPVLGGDGKPGAVGFEAEGGAQFPDTGLQDLVRDRKAVPHCSSLVRNYIRKHRETLRGKGRKSCVGGG